MIRLFQDCIIIDISSISGRVLQKIKIYLNGIDNIKFIINKSEIIIQEASKSQKIKILDYFAKLNLFAFDENAMAFLENIKKENINFKQVQDELIKLKNEVDYKTEDYVSFNKQSDNLLKIDLREYQRKSAYLLYKSGNGFDFSVPGAGKTIISYAVYINLLFEKKVDSLFIIGPKNSYNAWFDEYITCFNEKPEFENLSFLSVKESKTYLGTSEMFNKKIVFVNYEKISSLKNDIYNYMNRHKTLLIVDEAHKVKNPKARQTEALLEITKSANRRILLTGTPLPNGYEDLYSECLICFPDYKIIPYNYTELKIMSKNSEIDSIKEKKLMDALYPYFSRVSKKYLLSRGDLLPPVFLERSIRMDEYQQQIYDLIGALSDDIVNDWESSFALALKKAISIRRMQASANPILLNRAIFSSIEDFRMLMIGELDEEYTDDELMHLKEKIEKADEEIMKQVNSSNIAQMILDYRNKHRQPTKNLEALEICKELVSKGEKVLIWDVFVGNMDCLKNLIVNELNIKVGLINGSVNNEERQLIIDDFKNGEMMVLIASPATLAESISLHKCCQNAIYVNRNFNAAQFIQSKDRIHRINMPKNKTATYYMLSNIDTIDSVVSERLTLKENRMLRILDSEQLVVGAIDNLDNSSFSIDDLKAIYK